MFRVMTATASSLMMLGFANAAFAQETQAYTYDVHGRLITVVRTSGATSQTTTYVLDKADNRTTRSVGAVTTGLLAANNALEAPEEQATQQPAPSPAGEESETSAEPDLGANQ